MTYGEHQRHCVDDGTPMEKVNERGVTIDVCPRCGGTWLDHGELQQIMATLGSQQGFRMPAAHSAGHGGGHGSRRAYHRTSPGGFFGSFFGSS